MRHRLFTLIDIRLRHEYRPSRALDHSWKCTLDTRSRGSGCRCQRTYVHTTCTMRQSPFVPVSVHVQSCYVHEIATRYPRTTLYGHNPSRYQACEETSLQQNATTPATTSELPLGLCRCPCISRHCRRTALWSARRRVGGVSCHTLRTLWIGNLIPIPSCGVVWGDRET